MNVYLDNGATTMVAKEVMVAMQPYFTIKYGNASSLHSFGQEAKEAIEKARKIIAKSINASPEEIIFTSGGTESDNLAIKGVAKANNGKHIITSSIEHPAVMKACKTLEEEDYKITYLKVDREGFINLKELENAITKDTILVSIMHANNEIGTIQDVKKIGEICNKHGVYFHTDAVQGYTKIPIDVKEMNIDLMSVSSHKIHGPKGVGALYVKKGTKIKRQNDGGEHEFGLRAGTENVTGIVGFGKAIEITKTDDMKRLRDKLIKGVLENIPDCFLNGPRNKRLCNNVNISFRYVEGESILMHLNEKGIAVSTGSACASHSLEPSHVLKAIGLKPEDAHGSIRFTLSRYTTENEIDYTIKCLKEIIKKLREISPFKK